MTQGSARRQIVLRSDDMSADDFGELFYRLFGDLYAHFPPPTQPMVISGVYGRYDGVSFRRMSYRGDLTLALPGMPDEITFVIPTAGKVVFRHPAEVVGLPRIGLAIEKTDINGASFVDGHAHYGMSVRRTLLTARLACLLGQPASRRLRFDPVVNLDAPAFAALRAVLELATGPEFDLLINSSALMPVRLQEMLIDAVLEAWPHTYSEALQRPAPTIAPRHVKRAMDYLRAYPELPVNGAELARLSNVSLRSLQDGFRRFAGQSIVGYQRQVRLEQAYRTLRDEPERPVADVALGLGFSNAGRFSQYFQQVYGVSPVQVRKGGLR